LVAEGTELLLTNFAFEGTGPDDLAPLGIEMLQPTAYCAGTGGGGSAAAGSGAPTDAEGKPEIVQSILDDVELLGAIFGVQERATELIEEQQAELDEIAEAVAGLDRPTVGAVFFMN